jgi:hypothetical protein
VKLAILVVLSYALESAVTFFRALHALLAQDYFKKWHTISGMVDACQSELGVSIKVTKLPGHLAKSVMEKKLLCAKNKDGKFEHWSR